MVELHGLSSYENEIGALEFSCADHPEVHLHKGVLELRAKGQQPAWDSIGHKTLSKDETLSQETLCSKLREPWGHRDKREASERQGPEKQEGDGLSLWICRQFKGI